MLATALRELRHHPGRYLATLIAIMISVGFLAASSVVTATESQALGRGIGAPYSRADLVITLTTYPDNLTDATATKLIQGTMPAGSTTWGLASNTVLLQKGATSSFVSMYPTPPTALDWTSVGSAKAPLTSASLGADDVLISQRTAKTLGVEAGDQLTLRGGADPNGTPLHIAGLTNEPVSALGTANVYVSPDAFGTLTGAATTAPDSQYLVRLGTPMSLDVATAAVQKALASVQAKATVKTGAQTMADVAVRAMHGVDVLKYFLWVFAAIALVVGLITIANTFTILLTQRRQQLGLLRAVGASGAQVRRSIWLEALTLGIVGSALGIALAYGVAAIVGSFTGSIHFGLATPWRDLIIALVIGVAITLIACLVPAWRATRVPVLDALRPAEAGVAAHRMPIVRTVVCGLMLVVGLVGCGLSLAGGGSVRNLLLALAGAALTSLGVLFGAPLFVPGLLRGIGRLFGHRGVTAGAATRNVTRDPGRSSATATALMLAVGLIVTLQVGATSVQKTADDMISAAYPTPMWLQTPDQTNGIPAGVQAQAAHAQGITDSLVLNCLSAIVGGDAKLGGGNQLDVCQYDPGIARIASGSGSIMPDGQIYVTPGMMYADLLPGSSVAISPGNSSHIDPAAYLDVVQSDLVRDSQFALVSTTTFKQLQAAGFTSRQAVMLFDVSDAATAMNAMMQVTDGVSTGQEPLQIGGSALEREGIDQVLDMLVAVMTALLAVAVVIALVGVSNTLSLSVIERTRESALLRALGLQRGQLRLMLLYEALLLTLVSAVVGTIFGVFFGYVGAHVVSALLSTTLDMPSPVALAVDWPRTLILLAVLVVAAGVASLLPGRRAASATPVEALGDV